MSNSLQDRHALGEYEPVIDDSQDVTLLASSQNDTHTILRFSRPYVTCDADDSDITVSYQIFPFQTGSLERTITPI